MSEQILPENEVDSSDKRFNQDSFDVSDQEIVVCNKHKSIIVEHHCTVSCDECLKQKYPKYYGEDVTECNNK